MNDDIVERLREGHREFIADWPLLSVAADEIERLRGLIDALADAYNAMEPLRQNPDASIVPMMDNWTAALDALLAAATPKEDGRD